MIAQVITMIRGQNHDGIFQLAAFLERVHDELQLGVHEANTGMIGLHVFATSAIVFLSEFEAKLLKATVDSSPGDTIPKVRLVRRIDNLIERIEIEVFRGC